MASRVGLAVLLVHVLGWSGFFGISLILFGASWVIEGKKHKETVPKERLKKLNLFGYSAVLLGVLLFLYRIFF